MLAYGLDIGNGYAMVALIDAGGTPRDCYPARAWFMGQGTGMPTLCYVGMNGSIEVGEEGVASNVARYPGRKVACIKRHLHEDAIVLSEDGKPLLDDRLQEQTVSPLDVYAAIVRKVVELANEERLTSGAAPIYDVVLAHPASFRDDVEDAGGSNRLRLLKQATEKVSFGDKSLHVVGMIPEPAAAAFEFLCAQEAQGAAGEGDRDPFCAIVYDLGYGTFDTAIVERQASPETTSGFVYDVVGSPRSIEDVGCKDFDERLAAHMEHLLKEEYSYEPRNDIARERILHGAINVKHRLSKDTEASFQMPSDQGDPMRITVTRNEFESITWGLLNLTLQCFKEMLDYAASSGLDITDIVLSGGGSLMPMVREGVQKLMEDVQALMPGTEVTIHNPASAAAYGAARYAEAVAMPAPAPAPVPAPPPHAILNQYTQHAYGVLEGSEEVSILVNRGSKLPARASVEYTCDGDYTELWVYRIDREATPGTAVARNDCTSVFRFGFSVPANEACTFEFICEENGSLTMACTRPDDNTTLRRNSFEIWAGR